jgi:hypothetical protein
LAIAKRRQDIHHAPVAADPDQWSAQSKHSVAFSFKREYVDQPYKCWRCGAACTFTAQDQKYTFEVKKANINQRRTLCTACWLESHQLQAALSEHDLRWAAEKSDLRSDKNFCASGSTCSHVGSNSHPTSRMSRR